MKEAFKRRALNIAAALSLTLTAPAAGAAPPEGYYDSVDLTSAETARKTIHEAIDDHTRFPYTADEGTTDTWDILNLADEDPDNPNNVLDLYKNESYPKKTSGAKGYNREHTWPKSYGFPRSGEDNYPYTDCHHLMACDTFYNARRSNKPFANIDGVEYPTAENDGGEESNYSDKDPNATPPPDKPWLKWVGGTHSEGSWQVWSGRRGDIARAMFYMDVRYEGGRHGVTGAAEPDLILTDDRSLIKKGHKDKDSGVAYMGLLSTLMEWNLEDPVDNMERKRNDVVESFQGNRNPFADHPEWVEIVFGSPEETAEPNPSE